MSAYNYPELIDDPKNRRALSVSSIKNAFREFIRHKVSHAPDMTILERIEVNKHTFHDVKNSLLVSLQSYQKMIEGRKIEYFGIKDVYKENPVLSELLKVSNQKESIIKQLNEGKLSQKKALDKATTLQFQITDLESQFIREHIEKNIGKIQNTLNDNEIPQIPLKLYIIPPDDQRNYGMLITSGMSAYPMMGPGMAEPTCAELFMLLSPEWSLPLKIVKKDESYWPIDYLFRTAKYVHGNRQWFSIGHTFGNGDPPKPFANNTELCAFLFKFPYKELPPTFCELKIGNKPIYFLQLMPIYREEMEYIINNGPEEFTTRFIKGGVPEYIELERINFFARGGRDGAMKARGTFCRNCGTIVRNIDAKKKKVKCTQCGEIIRLE